ncbi:MAG: phospholipase D-like domain-containing protein [Pseudomonadota bacterium]|nr:phospholipase D-like domain-containing protein [Pseudomonadota bacterium]
MHFLDAKYGAALAAVTHGVFVLGGLLLYVLTTRAGRQRRHPSAALAWVLTIAVLPYLAVPLFLLFGTRKIAKPASPPAHPFLGDRTAAPRWAGNLLAGLGLAPAQNNQAVHFHADGNAALAALIAILDNARHRILVATFILSDDDIGNTVVAALVRRAAAGVAVMVLLEPLSRLSSSAAQLHRLRAAGIPVRWANAGRRAWLETRLNLRYHRKLVVCDDTVAWCGGRNLAAEYFTHDGASAPWEDLSLDVHGPLASQLGVLFSRDWIAAGGDAIHIAPFTAACGTVPAQLVPSGPDYADENIYAVLLAGAFQARERIIAVTPYFVPDDTLLVAWRMACRRGVRITLLVPERSNHRLADWARGRALRDLANAGAEIRLFPRMVHAKAVVIDDTIALCGSANLDSRSLFLNFELMVAFYGAQEIAWLTHWIQARAAEAAPYRPRQPSVLVDLAEGAVRVAGFQL